MKPTFDRSGLTGPKGDNSEDVGTSHSAFRNPLSSIACNPQSEIRIPQSEIRNPQSEIRNPKLPAGIYVHLPFCTTKCNYCDFTTALFDERTAQRYLAALLEEIDRIELGENAPSADTIYFGGGTPSLVPEQFIQEILTALAQRFSIHQDSEITLEMNPSPAESSRVASYRALGVNRLSIGVQSFDDRELSDMTRAHTASQARQAVTDAARKGFENLSLDLILGLPGQTARSFARSLQIAVSLPIRHLSVYILELHNGTPLHAEVMSQKTKLPSDDFVADQYREIVGLLESNGLFQYEISNFSRAGFQSRHNLKYWTRCPYIGFGVSSHSYDGSKRWNNTASLSRYLRQIESGLSPREAENVVTETDAAREQLFLGLRMRRGVAVTALNALAAGNHRLLQRWRFFCEQGWVEEKDGYCRLTTDGYLMSNEILSELM
ncbi:MAG TPA: radical SAM family heme chaperone HemW [Acidobacteriota bacterium]|jgi:oxygen-independent coproporphyrinogen-3 oxidase